MSFEHEFDNSCETTIPPEGIITEIEGLVTTRYPAGDANKGIYKLTGKTMGVNDTGYKNRTYASDKPDSVTREWNAPNCPYENYTVIAYLTIDDPDLRDDDISFKFYGPTHSTGDGKHWYIWDIEFDTGRTGWGWESPHPSTTSYCSLGTAHGNIIGKKIGYQVVIWKLPSGGAHMEAWIDMGDGLWKQTSSVDNPCGKVYSRHSSQNFQLRIDGCENITLHNISVKENTPMGEIAAPSSGGGGTDPDTPTDSIDPDVGSGDPDTDTETEAPKEYPPTLAPKKSSGIKYGGGAVWSSAIIHVIFAGSNGTSWGSVSNPSRSQIYNEFSKLYDQTSHADALIQYKVKRPKMGVNVVNTSTVINSGYESEPIIATVKNAIATGQVPKPNEGGKRHCYMVVTKPGITNSYGGGGWHSFSMEGSLSNYYAETTIVYASVTHRFLDGIMGAFAHEVDSMVTNPLFQPLVNGEPKMGWHIDSTKLSTQFGGEISDICVGTESEQAAKDRQQPVGCVVFPNGVLSAMYYSNQDGKCTGSKSIPSWISCPSGSTWDNAKQVCIVNPTSGGGGTTVSYANPVIRPVSSPLFSDRGGTKYGGTTVHLIFWGSYWNTGTNPSRQQIVDKLKIIFASKYFDHLYQYARIKRPKLGTIAINTSTVANSIDGNDIFNLINNSVSRGLVPDNPPPNGKHSYYVFLPPNSNSLPSGWHGFHGHRSIPADPPDPEKTKTYVFGAGRTNSSDTIHSNLSNLNFSTALFTTELAEMMTDPIMSEDDRGIILRTSALDHGDGSEIGDRCEKGSGYDDNQFRQLPNTTAYVSSWWSDQDKSCIVKNSDPTWLTCPTGYTYDASLQTCVKQSSTGGGTSPPQGASFYPVFPPIKDDRMVFRGGPQYTEPSVYVIFDGSIWSTRTSPWSKAQFETAMNKVLSTGYFDSLMQYRARKPKSIKYVISTDSLPNTYTTDDVHELILKCITKGSVPHHQPTSQKNIYFVIGGPNKTYEPSGNLQPIGTTFRRYDDPNDHESTALVGNIIPYYSDMNEVTYQTSGRIASCMTSPSVGNTYAWGWKTRESDPEDAGRYIHNLGSKITWEGVTVCSLWSNCDGKFVPPPITPVGMKCYTGGTYHADSQRCYGTQRDPLTDWVRYNDGNKANNGYMWNLQIDNIRMQRVSSVASIPMGTYMNEDGSLSVGTRNGSPPDDYTGFTRTEPDVHEPTNPPSGGGGGGGTVDLRPIFAPVKRRGMVFKGGPVVSGAKIFVIFSGSDWNTRTSPFSRQDVIDALSKVQASTYYDFLIQYGIKRPIREITYVTNTTFKMPEPFSPTNLAQVIADSIKRGQLPPKEMGMSQKYIYLVMAPYKATSTVKGAAGYHLATLNSLRPEDVNYVFGCSLYYDLKFTTAVITHEFVEMITDPLTVEALWGWRADLNVVDTKDMGEEISDVCTLAARDGTSLLNGVNVEQNWSNIDGGCIKSDRAPTWVSCRTGAKWDAAKQECVPIPGTGGGLPPTNPPTGNPPPTGSYDHIAFTKGNNNGRLYFLGTSGYDYASLNQNHSQAETNGFVQDAKDFKNVEQTVYIKLNASTGNGRFLMKARGGKATNPPNCAAAGVMAILSYDGRFLFAKTRRYNDITTTTNWFNGIGDIQGKWIGVKFVCYNVSSGVKYELYIDPNESNVWRKMGEVIDNGQGMLGGQGAVCNGRIGQPITWGGPVITWEWNLAADPDGFSIKRPSIREIDPTKMGDNNPPDDPYDPGSPYDPGDPYVPPPWNPGDPYDPGGWDPNVPYVHPPYNPGDPYVPGPNYDPNTGTFPPYNPTFIPKNGIRDIGGLVPLLSESSTDLTTPTGESGEGLPTNLGSIGSGGGGTSSGDGTGDVGTGVDTPNPTEKEILYERKVFWFRYNVNFKSGDACGVGKSPTNQPLENFYNVQGDVYVDGNLYQRTGIYVNSHDPTNPAKTSMFIDKRIRDLKVTMKRVGPNTMTGDIQARIRNSDGEVVSELGLINASQLTANDQVFTYPCVNNTRVLRKGDHISIEYLYNTVTDYIRIRCSQVDKIDGTNTAMFVFDGNKYRYDVFADFAAQISI